MKGAWNRKQESDLTADAFPEVQMGSRLEMHIPQTGSVTVLVTPQRVCRSARIGQADRDLRQSLVKENFKTGQCLMCVLAMQCHHSKAEGSSPADFLRGDHLP